MNNITLGKYIPYNSVIHRMDPRNKIISMIIFMVLIFLKFSSVPMNFFIYGCLFVILFIVMKIAHIRFRMLFSQLKALWIMIFILLVVNLIVPGDESYGYFEFFNTGWKIYYSAIPLCGEKVTVITVPSLTLVPSAILCFVEIPSPLVLEVPLTDTFSPY